VRDKPATDAEREAARCNATSRAQIQFAGTDAVSLEVNQESDCGAHYSGGDDVTLISLDDGSSIDLSKLLEPARRRALLPAAIKSAQDAFADFGTVDTVDSPPDGEVEGARLNVLQQWGVERSAGYWQIVGQVSCWPYVACGNGQHRFSIAGFSAPRALVGHDDLSPSLASIKAVFPSVRDAVSSPRRDLLVALTGDTLLVFTVRDGHLGAPALRLPVSGRIVMAQWAIGRFVPIWTAQLTRLLGVPAATPAEGTPSSH
jgi:hypothetical protein